MSDHAALAASFRFRLVLISTTLALPWFLAAGAAAQPEGTLLQPLVDFDGPGIQAPEGRDSFPLVRVDGRVPAGGIQVFLRQEPGSTAFPPGDYLLLDPQAFGNSIVGTAVLAPAADGYLLTIPEGDYDGNVLSDSLYRTALQPSGAVRLRLQTYPDAYFEDVESFRLTIVEPGPGSPSSGDWKLGTGTLRDSSATHQIDIFDHREAWVAGEPLLHNRQAHGAVLAARRPSAGCRWRSFRRTRHHRCGSSSIPPPAGGRPPAR